ncbi:DUF1345 domain-containing protein [Sphingomonas sp.]|uniref:DUF1345 domain-containing protein n=1 Tax=Sphingomonas sp. TaxID=28214 RepID=UPI003CC59093
MNLHLGRRVAPPRFILFCLLFPIAAAGLAPTLGTGPGLLAGFDIAATVFLVSITPFFRHGEADKMRDAAKRNDANRAVLLAITSVTLLVVLTSVFKEVQDKSGGASTVLIIATLVLAWLFSNTIYALHYAHLYYGDENGSPGDDKGLDFPHCDEPDYWDFLYFSFTLGMTFQTSDVEIASRRVRRIVLGHTLAAFVFNLGVLAFSINVLGSKG